MQDNNPISWRLLSFYASLFCSVLLPVLSFFWVLLRTGFPGDSGSSLFLLNGVSLLILFLPHAIRPLHGETALPLSVISIGSLLGLSLLGYASWFTSANLGYVIALAGFTSFALAVFQRRKELRGSYVLALLSAGLLLALYITGCVWGLFALSPTFTESLLVLPETELVYTVDTLFHATHAQMLRNYGVLSSGLDGFPLTYYHLGNHWVLGQLSNLTHIPVITLFNLGFPLISIPLFLFAFLDFALQVSRARNIRTFPSFLFWLVVLCVFMQIPKGLYSGGMLGISIFNNESFTLSMAFFFGAGACLLASGWRTDQSIFRILILAILPVLFFMACWSKISTGFVLSGALGYLYLRLKGWENRIYTASIFTCAIIFLVTYWFSVETIPFGLRNLSGEGTFQWFHFYRSTHDFKPFDWIVLFYFWTYAILLLVMTFRSHSPVAKFPTLPLEIALLVAIIGVLPSIAMTFSGGNSGYFAGIQLFFSAALVAGYSDRLHMGWDFVTSTMSSVAKALFVVIPLLAIASFMWMGIRENQKSMFRKNMLTRMALMGKAYDSAFKVSLFGKELRSAFNVPVQDTLIKMPGWQYIRELQKIEDRPASEKRNAVLYKDPGLPFLFPNQNCISETFLTPAYAGLAMIHGIPEKCKLGIYGEHYYRNHGVLWRSSGSPESIASMAKARGFHYLIMYEKSSHSFRQLQSISF